MRMLAAGLSRVSDYRSRRRADGPESAQVKDDSPAAHNHSTRSDIVLKTVGSGRYHLLVRCYLPVRNVIAREARKTKQPFVRGLPYVS